MDIIEAGILIQWGLAMALVLVTFYQEVKSC